MIVDCGSSPSAMGVAREDMVEDLFASHRRDDSDRIAEIANARRMSR
jgi:hypothetical protein